MATPPPLPPETRTVGQLVAETIHAYRRHVLGAFALGVPAAAVDVLSRELESELWLLTAPVVGAVLLTPAYIGAVLLVSGARPSWRTIVTAFQAGALAFLPFPLLVAFFILPGVAWLALVGLCVPVALLEQRRLGDSFVRAYRLARADYIHALGGLATLAIVVFLTRTMLFFLLRDLGESTALAASILADIVISPVLFLGAALLYYDQAARLSASSSDAAEHLGREHQARGRTRPQAR